MNKFLTTCLCLAVLIACSEDQDGIGPDVDSELHKTLILQDEPYDHDPWHFDPIFSEVRFVHAISGSGPVDLWVDGKIFVPSLGEHSASKYYNIRSGNRFLRVVPAGKDSSAAIFRRLVSIRSLTKMTTAYYGSSTDPDLLITQERFTYSDVTSSLVDSAEVKLINLNTSGNSYSLTRGPVGSTNEIIPSKNYTNLSAYIRIDVAGAGPFHIETAQTIVKTLSTFTLQSPGYRYTLIVTGDEAPHIMILQDEPCDPVPPMPEDIISEIRFVHAISGYQSVDIWLNAGKAITDLNYQSASEYRRCRSGSCTISLVPAGNDFAAAMFQRNVTIPGEMKMTMVFYGSSTEVKLLMIPERSTSEDVTSELTDSAEVKLIHVNTRGSSYSLTRGPLPSTQKLITVRNYENHTSYVRFDVAGNGPYHIEDDEGRAETLDGFVLKSPGYRYTFIITDPY